MITEAGSGHPGGSLSAVELLVGLYFSKLHHRPDQPGWAERDRFILSKGHIAPALYAVMAHSGYFPREELGTLRKLGSRLQGHPANLKLPGLEVSSGSLGQGLSVGVGLALGARLDGAAWRTYVLMGDGETQEGEVWEAAMSAGHYHLDNLCAVVDRNYLQIDGCTEDVMTLDPYPDKWAAFGWHVLEIDGHSLTEVVSAYERAAEAKGKPTVIIARTVKGKGVPFMEDKAGWHGRAPKPEELAEALKHLTVL
jgi:transketolase